jgi:hypothetical protein
MKTHLENSVLCADLTRAYPISAVCRHLWRAHRLLFDTVMNITCVYSSHAERCWDLQSVAPFSITLSWSETSMFRDTWGLLSYVYLLSELILLTTWALGKPVALRVLLVVDFLFVISTGIFKYVDRKWYFAGALFFIVCFMVPGYGILLSFAFYRLQQNPYWSPYTNKIFK